jgi:hypothetical protein
MQNIIKVPKDTSIVFIGDIHEHEEQFFSLIDKIKPSKTRLIVSVGDVYDKGFGELSAQNITKELINLNNKGIAYAVKGNHELKIIKKSKNKLDEYLSWWSYCPLSLRFDFYNGAAITVVHAGITPHTSSEDLNKSIEVCYVREIDEFGKMIPLIRKTENGKIFLVREKRGKLWHEIYDGRFGYIVSGHIPQFDGNITYYNYSCNIDTAVFDTGKLSGQEFLPNGSLGESFSVQGKASKPELFEII